MLFQSLKLQGFGRRIFEFLQLCGESGWFFKCYPNFGRVPSAVVTIKKEGRLSNVTERYGRPTIAAIRRVRRDYLQG
jgi:hypothetical protein